MKMKTYKNFILLFVLMVCTSCVNSSDDTHPTIYFDLGMTGVFLLALGLLCNQILFGIFTDQTYDENRGNFHQILVFASLICSAIACDISIIVGCEIKIVVGCIIGSFFVALFVWNKILDNIEEKYKIEKERIIGSHEYLMEFMNKRGVNTADYQNNGEYIAELNNPIRKISRIVGKLAFVSAIAGLVCIYYAWF